MTLSEIETGELRNELRRREAALPEPLAEPQWGELIALVERGIRRHAVGLTEDHFRHYVFQAAITAIWGHDFWTWWNSHAKPDALKPFE
jgi:hypothetical protein